MNIAILDAATLGDTDLNGFKKFGNTKIYNNTAPDERVERISGNEIIVTNKVIIDREVMNACPELKLICISATGMNNIDLEYAAKKNITVKNVAGYSTASVTQMTFAMIFYLLNHLPYFDNYVKSGTYAESEIFTNYGRSFHELGNMQTGIIGMGAIGKKVAEIASSFGSKVAYYSTSGRNKNAGFECLDLDELLQSSDIISIHAPLNNNTNNLIDATKLNLMKRTAILINVGRGGIVNEQDLADTLDNEIIAGAGVDVFTSEPIKKDNPLLKVKNKERLIMTPHVAWASHEARKLLIEKLLNNIEEFMKDLKK
ncbi:MAG TPA: D-2-hydroxyacid dehydrogenase [Bacteroidales bacterium]|nr:D-2-hydroxyacid dehydrogenase [Bacteroidales bacterium]